MTAICKRLSVSSRHEQKAHVDGVALDDVVSTRPTRMLDRDPLSRMTRIEGLAALIVATVGYALVGGGGGKFALLFLVPDLSMLGYLAGRAWGKTSYNVAHSFALPAVLATGGLLAGFPDVLLIALIWCAHVGFDRAVGMGPVK